MQLASDRIDCLRCRCLFEIEGLRRTVHIHTEDSCKYI